MNMKTPRYKIKVIGPKNDTYPHSFACNVIIIDHLTNKTYRRIGLGRFIGNFAPIWVSLHGKNWQLTELERETL